jgi:hypothetical protein
MRTATLGGHYVRVLVRFSPNELVLPMYLTVARRPLSPNSAAGSAGRPASGDLRTRPPAAAHGAIIVLRAVVRHTMSIGKRMQHTPVVQKGQSRAR